MDDFVVNVRQIGNYPKLQQLVTANDLLLVQQGGLGGPYACITQDGLLGQVFQRLNVGMLPAPNNQGIATTFITTPLGQRQGFNWYVDDDGLQRYLQNGPAGFWSMVNTTGELVWATIGAGEKDDQIDPTQWADVFSLLPDGTLVVGGIQITGPPTAESDVATVAWVQANTVASFNGRTGPVTLSLSDVNSALSIGMGDSVASQSWVTNHFAAATGNFAPLNSPVFTGTPTAPTAAPGTSSQQLATTSFVTQAIASSGVSSFNTRTGTVTLTLADVTGTGVLASPALTGTPTAPTAAPGTNTTQIASTAFVAAAMAAAPGGVTSFNTRTGAISLTLADVTGTNVLANTTLTGVPTAPTAVANTSTTQLATTAFVMNAVSSITGGGTGSGVSSFNGRSGVVTLSNTDITTAGGATLVSPAFTGTPTAPTAAGTDNSTTIATTAFVKAAISSSGVASFNSRTGAVTLTTADVTGVGGALVASPTFTGVPAAPTATAGTSTTQIATTAFVTAAVNGSVLSFNTRTGAITLTAADITAAGGALLAGPTFTGLPSAPTAAPGTSTTQLATTAFVAAAMATVAGVTSFNTRSGAVTLTAADVTAVGGALLASPTFTGVPAGPTATAGTNTTQLATTAFVTAAVAATPVGVTAFNSRTGSVTLSAADITGAGGALLASPNFTGTPTAPTAAPTSNSVQIATTAFVQSVAKPSGSRVPLANVNITAGTSATVATFFYTFSNTYDLYEIEFTNFTITPAGPTPVGVNLQISINGTSWDAGASNYSSTHLTIGAPGATPPATGPSMVMFTQDAIGGDNAYGVIRFGLPWKSGMLKFFSWAIQASNNGTGQFTWGNGNNVTTAPLLGVQIACDAGTGIGTGNFTLYGVTKYPGT